MSTAERAVASSIYEQMMEIGRAAKAAAAELARSPTRRAE